MPNSFAIQLGHLFKGSGKSIGHLFVHHSILWGFGTIYLDNLEFSIYRGLLLLIYLLSYLSKKKKNNKNSDKLELMGFHLEAYAIWLSFHIGVWGVPLEARPFDKLLLSHCFRLCSKRNVENFHYKWRMIGGCGIYFTFIPLFRPMYWSFWRHSFQCYLIQLAFSVNQKGIDIIERSLVAPHLKQPSISTHSQRCWNDLKPDWNQM